MTFLHPTEPDGQPNPVRTVACSPNGRFAMSGAGNVVFLWDVESGKRIREFKGHKGEVLTVVFSPDGRYALSGSSAGDNDRDLLMLWEIETGNRLQTFQEDDVVCSAVFSSDGRRVLSAGKDRLCLWDAFTGKCLRVFHRPQDRTRRVALSPDGHFILEVSKKDIFSDSTILRILNMETGACLRTLPDFHGMISTIQFAPDQLTFAMGGYGSGIHFLNWNEFWQVKSPFRLSNPLSG